MTERRAVLLHYALFELRRALHAVAWSRHSSNITPEENPKPPGAVRRVCRACSESDRSVVTFVLSSFILIIAPLYSRNS